MPYDPNRQAELDQRAAERTVEQNQRQQEQAAEDTAKAQRKADLSAQELAYRAQGMIPVTTADGNLHPDPLFDQKQAAKAKKEQDKQAALAAEALAKAARADAIRSGRRHQVNPVDGSPIYLESEQQVELRRQQAADQLRKSQIDSQINAAEAEHGSKVAQAELQGIKPLTEAARKGLAEKALPKVKQEALFALQSHYQQQAKGTTKAGWWDVVNNPLTPEAQKAQEHLQRLQSPDADLTDEDLATLAANDATKPHVEKLQKLRDRLTKDEELQSAAAQHKARLADLKLRRDAPEQWAAAVRARRAQLPPDQLKAELDKSAADLSQRHEAIQQQAAQLNSQVAAHTLELDTLAQQAAARRQQGIPAGDIVSYEAEDGTVEHWPKDLATQRESIQARLADTEAQQADTWAQLHVQQQELHGEAVLHDEAGQLLADTQAQGAQMQRQQGLSRLQFTPGHEQTAQELDTLDAEAQTRLADLNTVWEGKPPPEVVQALQQDVEQRSQQSLAMGAARQQAAQAAYTDLKQFSQPDKAGNPPTGYEINKRKEALAQGLAEAQQITPEAAAKLIDDMESHDWTSYQSKHGEVDTVNRNPGNAIENFWKAQADVMTGDPRKTRVLSNGGLIVNPQITDPKEYEKTVNEAVATPEARAEAMARLPDVRAQYGKIALETLQNTTAEAHDGWLKFLATKPKDVSEVEYAAQYADKLKAGGWPGSKIIRMALWSAGQGVYDIGQQALGTVAGLLPNGLGSETAMQGAQWAAGKAEFLQQEKSLYGATGDNWISRGLFEQLPRLAGSILPAAGGAKLAQGGIKLLAATSYGSKLLPSLAAALETAATPAQAVKAVTTLTRAGVAGAAGAGAVQTYGAQLADIYGTLRRENPEMTHAQALSAAQQPAILSAAVTALMTTVGGAHGVEKLLASPAAAKELFNKQFKTQMARAGFIGKEAAKGATKELWEELPDELFSQYQSAVASHPNDPQAGLQSIAQFMRQLPELALAIGVMGGAGEAVSGYQESSISQSPGPQVSTSPANLPETVAAAESAIDALQIPNADEATLARTQDAARGVLYIAQGTPLTDLDADTLAALDIIEDPQNPGSFINGRIVPGKNGVPEVQEFKAGMAPVSQSPNLPVSPSGMRPVRVKLIDGQPVISQQTLDNLEKLLPAVRAAVPQDEKSRLQKLAQPPGTPAGQAPAANAGPNANPGPVQAPAANEPQPAPSGQHPAQPGAAVAAAGTDQWFQELSDEELDRNIASVAGVVNNAAVSASQDGGDQGFADIAKLAQERLERLRAEKAQRSQSPRPQVSPSPSLDPAAQQRSTELATLLQSRGLTPPQALAAAQHVVSQQGIIGASAEEQYTAGIDDAMQQLHWIRGTGKNYAFIPPSLNAKAPEATEGSAGTPARSASGSPLPPLSPVPTQEAPTTSHTDKMVIAKQKAMKAIPVANRPRFQKFYGALDQSLARYAPAFPGGVTFTDGKTSGINYTGAGIAVTNATTNPALEINLAQLFASSEHLDPKALPRFVKQALLHEVRHLAALKVITPKQARDLWQALTPALKSRVYASYFAADIAAVHGAVSEKQLLALASQALGNNGQPSSTTVNNSKLPAADPFHMAHEFLRMLDEDAEFAGQTSEAMDAHPGLGKAILEFLSKVIDDIKRLIATDLDQTTRVQVREFQSLVEGARKKLLATLPAPGTAYKGSPPPTLSSEALAKDGRASVLSGNPPPTPTRPPTPFSPVLGASGTAYTDSNDAIDFQWAVVDVNSLNVSNDDSGRINPAYPQELQPRDRTSAASEAQVNDIAKNFNLDRLSASSSVGDGAPIIGQDAVVESGNGRVMGARRSHATGKPSASSYRDALISRAAEFGLNAEQVEAVPNPVLVRVRTTDVNRTAFVLAANVSTIAPKREMEQAKIDAKQIVPDLFDSFVPSEDGDIFTAANADFIRGFISAIVPPAERGQVIDASGNLSQTGLRRIRNALFVHAYGTSPEALNALGRLTESIDATDTGLARSLLAMAPRFAEQNARIANGALYPFSITENLAQALQKLADLRARGEKVETWLQQDRIPGIGDDPGPVTTALVEYLHANRQRPRQILDTLDRYAKALDSAGDPRQISLFGDEKPDAQTLWKLAANWKEPTLAMGRKSVKLSTDVADAVVANENTDGWLDTYISNGWEDAEREFPGGSAAIAQLLEQLPQRQHDRKLNRGINPRFGEVDRPFYSFSFSPESARLQGSSVTTKTGPTKYLSLEDVAAARIRRDGKSHYAGMQSEVWVPASELTLAKASTSPSLPVSESPPLPPKTALRLYRKLTAQQASGNPLTAPQSQALERAERSLGQLFLFDTPNQTLKPAEDLVLEQERSAGTPARSDEQLRLFKGRTTPDPRLLAQFGTDWPHGWDTNGFPNLPRTLPDDSPLLADTTSKTTATLPADHPLVLGGMLPAGRALPRKALHQAIVAYFMRQAQPVPAGTQPTLYAMAGGGGAGKSTILGILKHTGSVDTANAVHINADDIKELIPEYHDLKQAGDGRAAATVHEESSQLTSALMDRAIPPGGQGRYNVVFDGTLSNRRKNLALITRWQAAGLRVHLIAVTIDPREAVTRAILRGAVSGRWVPGSVLTQAHQDFNAAVKSYLPVVDAADLYDNTPPAPHAIAQKTTRQQAVSIANPEYWSIIDRRSHEALAPHLSAANPAAAGSPAGRGQTPLREVQPESQGSRSPGTGTDQGPLSLAKGRTSHLPDSEPLPDIPGWSALQKSLLGLDKPEREARTTAYHQQHPDAQAALDARKAVIPRIGRPIPPAWTDVQIFPPGSRLLAKGRDDKGRLQSIYSSADTQAALAAKFARQKRVNALMPRILDGVKNGLRDGTEEASVLRLIYLTGFRNGGEGDTGAKVKAYGATTLLAEHVSIDGDTVAFDFTGKLGVQQQHTIVDAALATDLAARKAKGGRLFNTSPDKVLAALRTAAGTQDIKVHDLRTWNATSLAAELIQANPAPETETDYWLKRDQIGDVVARKLGDTRSIVLESYIDPIVFAKWQESLTLTNDSERPKISRKSAAARGAAGQLQRPFEDYERSLRDELLPSPGEGSWPARDRGLTLFKGRTTVDSGPDLFGFNTGLGLDTLLTPRQKEAKLQQSQQLDLFGGFEATASKPAPKPATQRPRAAATSTPQVDLFSQPSPPAAAPEPEPTEEIAAADTEPEIEGYAGKAKRLSQQILRVITGQARIKKLTWENLFKLADEAFGGTQADGTYTVKDAYDAMEMAVNAYVVQTNSRGGAISFHPVSTGTPGDAVRMIRRLKDILADLPTQTKRTEETDTFQQFSTVPPLAFVANWVTNLDFNDIVLEPSAGVGGLAAFAKASGASVIANELSPRRAALLRATGIAEQVFEENAEQINNVLPATIRPTVVVMNPPFSTSPTGKKDTANAIKHIESALARLPQGGRLVAIVGEGMALDRPAFRSWWQGMMKKHHVRANVQVNGNEYAKYGTTWDNQIVVIDKVAPPGPPKAGARITNPDGSYFTATGTEPAPQPLTGRVESIDELPALLYAIRNDRPEVSPSIQGAPGAGGPESNVDTPRGSRPGAGTAGGTPDAGRAGAGNLSGGMAGTPESGADTAGNRPDRAGVDQAPPAVTGQDGRPGSTPDSGGVAPQQAEIRASEEMTDAVYDAWHPRVLFPGAKAPPTNLAESAAMAAVDPPATSYRPSIPTIYYADPSRDDFDQRLATHALESIALAGNAHQQTIAAPLMPPNEREEWKKRFGTEPAESFRRGFFIGDGTGAGKGRQIAGIIFDNWNQGRKKAVWISEPNLFPDARRDLNDVADLGDKLFAVNDTKAGEKLAKGQGVGFISYSTLRSKEQKPEPGKLAKTRVDQIVEWLGADFDGVIAFDEAHNMGSAMEMKGNRGNKEASQQALAGLELQQRLPNARVVYLSATGATEVSNLAYAERLGLWGPGTPFRDRSKFVSEISAGGVAAMELIAQNLKAMGLYVARSISWHDVSYDRASHALSPDQRQIYDDLAEAWQKVLNNMDEAMKVTGITATDPETGNEKTNNSAAKSAIRSKFWGGHQRFFNQLITAMKLPTVLTAMERELAADRSIVIQLVNTQEASLGRAIDKAAATAADSGDEIDLENLDLSPRDQLLQLVQSAFPVIQMEEFTTTDSEGNERTGSRPALDSKGNPILNQEAVAMRDALLDKLASTKVPSGPLEILLDHFGADKIAEVTGRTKRVVWKKDKDGRTVRSIEKRSVEHGKREAADFQDGARRILVFSKAGGTGRSFHADRRAKNQQKRVHILLQPGWQASAAVQGFGRTHRNNQVSTPHYLLAETDIVGEKRFMSSIARRLDQLGALTKGQRQTGSQGFFQARDNLESLEAKAALESFYTNVLSGSVPTISPDVLETQMGLKLRDKEGQPLQDKPPITQFLNRLLSLKLDLQQAVFDAFSERLDAIIETKLSAGTLDLGLENVTALRTVENNRQTVYEDAQSGAKAELVSLTLTQPTKRTSYEGVKRQLADSSAQVYPWARSKRTGKLFALTGQRNSTTRTGSVETGPRLTGVTRAEWMPWTDFNKRYDRVSGQTADSPAMRAEWQQQFEAAPATEDEPMQVLTGTMLPIWDKIPGTPRIVRAQTEDGRRMIGRVIPDDMAEKMVSDLTGKTAVITPAKAVEMARHGDRVRLSNGWTLKTSRLSGETRYELTGPGYTDHTLLDAAGVMKERIQFNMRYFLPTGNVEEVLSQTLTAFRATIQPEGTTLAKGRTTVNNGQPSQTIANAAESGYTPTSYADAAPDPFTGIPSLITGQRLPREQGRAIGHAHAQRLRAGLSSRPDSGNASPALAASRAGTLNVAPRQSGQSGQPSLPTIPVLSAAQFNRLQKLPLIGEGAEAKVYADRAQGVVYKVLQGYAPVPGLIGSSALGVWPQVYYTADGRLDYAFATADRPRQLVVRLAVQTLVGGTPTEIVGIGPDGHIILKQPLSPAPEIGRDDDFIDNSGLSIARNRAGLVEIPKALLSDPQSPRVFLAVVEGRPWLLMDLHPDNFVGDNQAQGRINDAIVGQIPASIIAKVPGLAQFVKDAAQRAKDLGDRSDRLFKASTSPSLPVSSSPSLVSRAASYVGNKLLDTAEGAMNLTSATTRAVGLENPLQRAGWNHLDRAASAKLAAHTRWLTTPTHALANRTAHTLAANLVSLWTGEKNPAPFLTAAHALKRELLPDSVLPREVLAKKREMEIKTAMGSQRAMDLVRALAGNPKFSDLAYPKEFAENPMHRRNLYEAMTGERPMSSLPPELQALAAKLRGILVSIGQEAVKQGRMSTETFDNLRGSYMPHYYKEDVQKEKSLFHKFRLGVRDILAQRTTAWHIVDTTTKDANGEPRLVSHTGNQWRFRNQEHMNAFFEDFITQEALAELQNRAGKKYKNLTAADLMTPSKLDPEVRGRLQEIKRTLHQRYDRRRPLTIAEQEKAGLIMDPVYAIARYAAQMAHDNSTAEWFNFVAADPANISTIATPGFTEIPDNPRFGRLAGKFVQNDIAQQVLEMIEAPNIALQIYDATLGWWKAGKALALDTPIPTPTGWTTMGELQEGDTIFDEQGQPCRVDFTTAVMHDHTCYRVAFSDGTSIIADAEHLWSTCRHGGQTSEIHTTEQIRATLHYGTRRYHAHSIPNALPLQTSEAELPISPYVLGAWLGDGTSRAANITIGGSDLDAMLTLLTDEGIRCGAPRKDKRNQVRTVQLQSPDGTRRKDTIQAVLRRMGLLGPGLKHIPTSYLRAGPDQRMALLQGLMDTDGTASTRGKVEFSTSNPRLRDDVLELCRSLGFKPSWSTKPTSASDSFRIRFHAFADFQVFRLPRKAARLRTAPTAGRRRSQSRQIISIDPVPSVPVRCIQVSSASKLYLAGAGMVPTHNTVLNPGTHVRNVLGNIFFSQLAGNSVWNPGNVTYYREALQALRNGGPVLADAYDAGVLGADFVSAELRQTLRQLLPDPATIVDDGKAPTLLMGIGKAIGKYVGNPANAGFNKITALYQAEDEIFKLAAYLKTKSMLQQQQTTVNGSPATLQQLQTLAAEHVRKWFPYFDSGSSGTLKLIGRTAMPFLGFYRESIRIFGHALKERPLALAAGLSVPSIITMLSAMALGLDDDDLDEIKEDMRGKAGKLLGPTPLGGRPLFSMLLPVRSDTGQVQQFDISAIHPFTNFLGNTVEARTDGWWPQMFRSFVAAGPLGNLIYSNMTGEDAHFGSTIVEPNMTTGEAAKARLKDAAKTILPPLAPFGTGFNTLMTMGERTSGKTLEVRSPTQAMLRTVGGLDVRNATPDLYRLADDWRKANGYEVQEGMDYGSTTPVSRARKALYSVLTQDEPNPTAIQNILKSLDKMGHPVRTEQDVNRLLFYRDPAKLIGGNKAKGITATDAQAQFRQSLDGEARQALESALQEYRRIQQKAPLLVRQAASL